MEPRLCSGMWSMLLNNVIKTDAIDSASLMTTLEVYIIESCAAFGSPTTMNNANQTFKEKGVKSVSLSK